MFNRILVVCVGNICRSPTAETLFKEALPSPEFQISSAGISAVIGHDIEPNAKGILQSCGHTPHTHQARQLNRGMLHEADLVLVMEYRHTQHIFSFAPEVRGKIHLLGKWQQEKEIADPYQHGEAAFLRAYQEIAQAVQAWTARIHPSHRGKLDRS